MISVNARSIWNDDTGINLNSNKTEQIELNNVKYITSCTKLFGLITLELVCIEFVKSRKHGQNYNKCTEQCH